MKLSRPCVAIGLVAAFLMTTTAVAQTDAKAKPVSGYKVGDVVADFTLPDLDGKSLSLKGLAKDRKAVVIDFWSPRCPFCQSHEARLTSLDKKWKDQGVAMVHIASNQNENRTPEAVAKLKDAMKKHAQEFPALVDLENKIADAFAARVTPTVFILDAATLKVRYSGTITDDPMTGENVTHDYVDEALTAILAGKDPATTSTDPKG